ncbi:MAG: hypothetical protein WB474_01250 [Nitrososphaeraceae archaeon]
MSSHVLLSPDLSYRLEDEYNIMDEMQLGDWGIECPIKDLRWNLEPIFASMEILQRNSTPHMFNMILIGSWL